MSSAASSVHQRSRQRWFARGWPMQSLIKAAAMQLDGAAPSSTATATANSRCRRARTRRSDVAVTNSFGMRAAASSSEARPTSSLASARGATPCASSSRRSWSRCATAAPSAPRSALSALESPHSRSDPAHRLSSSSKHAGSVIDRRRSRGSASWLASASSDSGASAARRAPSPPPERGAFDKRTGSAESAAGHAAQRRAPRLRAVLRWRRTATPRTSTPLRSEARRFTQRAPASAAM